VEVATNAFEPASIAPLLTTTACRWRVASVQRAAEDRLREWISQKRPADKYQLLGHADLPIQVDVERPERVGLDRLAAAVAANRLRQPNRPAIVVDAGTAITVNLVTADGVFRGGVILPGFKLTTQALAEGTDLLPLVEFSGTCEPPPVVGRSTEAAIRSGLFWGSVGAVRDLIGRVASQLPMAPQVFVTGGDAYRFAGFISADATYVPDLVLIGIVASEI
jgi:type III pantothenate kinase